MKKILLSLLMTISAYAGTILEPTIVENGESFQHGNSYSSGYYLINMENNGTVLITGSTNNGAEIYDTNFNSIYIEFNYSSKSVIKSLSKGQYLLHITYSSSSIGSTTVVSTAMANPPYYVQDQNITKSTEYATVTLSSGWTLLGQGFGDQDLNVSTLSNVPLMWAYRADGWNVASPDGTLTADIPTGYTILESITAGEGYWVYTPVPINITVPTTKLTVENVTLEISPPSTN